MFNHLWVESIKTCFTIKNIGRNKLAQRICKPSLKKLIEIKLFTRNDRNTVIKIYIYPRFLVVQGKMW
ncbi:hypothetical protein DLR61_14870 [Vibrio tarriae]|nr:hypothetical protein DLR61_14870 [Vibrio tarriae]